MNNLKFRNDFELRMREPSFSGATFHVHESPHLFEMTETLIEIAGGREGALVGWRVATRWTAGGRP